MRLNLLMSNNLLYFFIICLCCGQVCNADEKNDFDNVIINVVTEDAYPYQYLENATIKGPASELVKRVLEEAGFKYRQHILPWARAYHYAKTKSNTLIYSIARTAEREHDFHWVGYLTQLNYYLVALNSAKFTPPVSIQSLKHLDIGTIRKSANHHYLLTEGFKSLHLLTSPEQTVKMLKLGRIDLFPTDFPTFQLTCLHLMLNCREIVPVYRLEQTSTSLYLAFSLDTDKRIVTKMRQAYKKVMKSYFYLNRF
ncbi:MAG: transporter substrate-binding domain-containing protein [Alteromonadaceae bacterium]|nr:transporter substrate-binding domain-containing protein [Alteromonadaceae bacterium]